MGIRFNGPKLKREMARRGLRTRDLAELTGYSDATISHARAERDVAAATFRKITRVIADTPPIDGGLLGE